MFCSKSLAKVVLFLVLSVILLVHLVQIDPAVRTTSPDPNLGFDGNFSTEKKIPEK